MDRKFIYITSRKHVRCTGKLLKIKSKLILIPFTSLVEYVFFFFFFCFFFVVQNVVGKKSIKRLYQLDLEYFLLFGLKK